MKKYGFTLAEVLIALGIIGVVASLTAPTFVSNIQNSTNASRLSSTVSTLENAFTTMIVKEDVDDIFETTAWRTSQNSRRAFAGEIGDFLAIAGFREINNTNDVITGYYDNKGPYYMSQNGSRQSNISNELARLFAQSAADGNTNHALELKNGAMVFLLPNVDNQVADEDVIKNAGGSLYNTAADVWIDVNGTAAPNTMGRDIFAFYLGDNGKLYPLGGKDVAIKGGNLNTWNGGGNRSCTNGNIGSGGLGCTGRVVAEGFKINY